MQALKSQNSVLRLRDNNSGYRGLNGQGVFFLLWPLFARAPRHWFLENFLLSAPGVQSVFFLLRSVGRRDLSAGPEQKKKHHPGCFFFLLRPRGKAGEGEARCWPGCFFCCGPFFARAPRHWFLENFLLSAPGVQSVVFFVALRWAPRPFGGARAKKKTPWVVFFFLLRPRADAHSLTAGLGGDASPSPGWCLLFFCCGAAPAGPGWCFCFLLWPRPDAHSLTVGWGDFGKARVVFFFFCCGPAGSF